MLLPGSTSRARTTLRKNGRIMMNEPRSLCDKELLKRAYHLRLLALRGNHKARGAARALEREVWRRFGTSTTMNAVLVSPQPKRSFWRFFGESGWMRLIGSQRKNSPEDDLGSL